MRFSSIQFAAAALAFALLAPSAWAQEPPEPPEPPEAQRPERAPRAPRATPVSRATLPARREWVEFRRATELQIRDTAAMVIVRVEEDRTNYAASILNPGPLRAPEMRQSGRRLIIDGKLRRQIRSCRGSTGGRFEVEINNVGWLSTQNLPIIEIRAPEHVDINANGAMHLFVGRAESAKIRQEGCGAAEIVGVDDGIDITVAGQVSARVYEADEAEVRVAGEGDVMLGVVHDGLTAAIAGRGSLTAQRVDGDTNIAVQGQGDVTIRSGRAEVMSVVIAGTGDVTHNGSAEQLDAVIIGAGDVRIRHVEGEVNRRIVGGGDVIVGRPR